jgi:hypothetical protein
MRTIGAAASGQQRNFALQQTASYSIQQATKVELYINLKTAKAFGISVPIPMLGRADG